MPSDAVGPSSISVEDRVAQSIRDWIASVTPCHCAPDYWQRGLIQPDCQMHDLVLDADTAARDLRAEGLLRE
jgi:hypothetical protein